MLTTAYYFLQVVLCSGVMMGYYWLVLRNNRFHQYNRFYLLGIALLSWIVPLIKIRWSHPTINQDTQVFQFLSYVADNNSQIDETITNNGFQWNLDTTVTLMYTAVSGILLVGMLLAFFKIYQLLKKHSCKNVGDVYLILTSAKGTPFSFFRYIFWNQEIDIRSEAGKQILQHELTHVQQKHSIDKIAIQLMLIVGWFNPFFWLLKKEVEMIHEFIADNKAVKNGDTVSLAQMLLTAAYPQQKFALTHPFFFSPIKRRLQMLSKNKNTRFSYIRRLIVLPLMAIVVVLFAFRNKEQRENATVSVASVVETFVDGITKKNPELNLSEPKTNFSIIDTNIIKAHKITITSDGKLVELNGKVNIKSNELNNALIILDGKKTDNATLEKISPNDIETVNVLKGESASLLYGEEGKNGVVRITTKQYAISQDQQQEPKNKLSGNLNSIANSKSNHYLTVPDTLLLIKDKAGNILSPQPIVFIDGKKGNINSISPDQIKSIDIYKSDSSIKMYGEEGKNGVVLITTKNTQIPSNSATKISSATIIGYHDKENISVNDFLKRNPSVKDVYWWTHSSSFNIQLVLENGTQETYDIAKPENERKAVSKYGKLPKAPPPPPPSLISEGVKLEPVKKEKLE